MDNARIHNSDMMRTFYNENNLNIKLLSPYSYILNPIEPGFSKIKLTVRRKWAGGYYGGSENLIKESVNDLTDQI